MYEIFENDEYVNDISNLELDSETRLDELEEPLEGNPVLVKTFDGTNTGLSEIDESDTFETESLEKIYGNILDSISEDDSLDTKAKIERLNALKNQYLSEFEGV